MAKTRTVIKKTVKDNRDKYILTGVAKKAINKKKEVILIVYLDNGDVLYINKAKSEKQQKYAALKTTEKYNDKKDIYDIYNCNLTVHRLER